MLRSKVEILKTLELVLDHWEADHSMLFQTIEQDMGGFAILEDLRKLIEELKE